MPLGRYRQHFRRKVIPRWYSARAHLVMFTVFELIALAVSAWWVPWSMRSLGWMGLSLLWASTALYLVHRFMLHQKIPGFHWAHKMHHWHHTFYQAHAMEYDELNDVYMLLMPPWLQLIYFVLYLPLVAWLLSFVLPLEFVPHLVFTLTLWYGLYELIHWVEHLPAHHRVMRWGWALWMKQHHIGHHHPHYKDSKNFGIVEPSQDFLWGSKL